MAVIVGLWQNFFSNVNLCPFSLLHKELAQKFTLIVLLKNFAIDRPSQPFYNYFTQCRAARLGRTLF